jgi:hypothetical protein
MENIPGDWTLPNIGCRIKPIETNKTIVSQFNDSSTARDWFKDPTYSQRINIRKKRLSDAVIDTNPSLQEYHRIKTLEKLACSTMQSM